MFPDIFSQDNKFLTNFDKLYDFLIRQTFIQISKQLGKYLISLLEIHHVFILYCEILLKSFFLIFFLLQKIPDIGAQLTGGCAGFASRYMRWPEELLVGGVLKNENGTIWRWVYPDNPKPGMAS